MEELIKKAEEGDAEANAAQGTSCGVVYTVVCEDVAAERAENIIKSLNDEDMLFENQMVSMNRLYNSYKLVDAYIVDYDYTDGDLSVTIKGSSSYLNGLYKVGSQELRIGRVYTVKTLGFEIQGVINSLDETELKAEEFADGGLTLDKDAEDNEENNECAVTYLVACSDMDQMLAESIIGTLDDEDVLINEEPVSMTCLYNNYQVVDAEIVASEYIDGTLWLTIEGTATYINGNCVVGSQEVRIGRGYTVKTLGFEAQGMVYSLEIEQ